MDSSLLRNFSRPALLISSATIELLSFHQDILRDGNQSIASALAIIGILGLIAALRSRDNDDAPPVRSISFEYLGIVSAFALLYLLQIRNTFFAEGPGGANLLKFFIASAAALLVIILSCMTRIRASTGAIRLNPTPTLAHCGIVGGTAIVLIALNFQTRAEIISITEKVQVTIKQNGFPFDARHQISAIFNPAPPNLETISIILPNAASVHRDPEKITVHRFYKETEYSPADTFKFKDGTSLAFNPSYLAITLPNMPEIDIDFSNRSILFRNKPPAYWLWLNAFLNLIIAALLLRHSHSFANRLSPNSTTPRVDK